MTTQSSLFYTREQWVEWTRTRHSVLVPRLPKPRATDILDRHGIKIMWSDTFEETPDVSPEEIAGTLAAFPTPVLGRCRFKKILLVSTRYYHRDSSHERVKRTTDVDEAISQHAWMSEYSNNRVDMNQSWQEVEIIKIPNSVDPITRRICAIEVLAHAVGHALTDQLRADVGYAGLRFPDGQFWDTIRVDRELRRLAASCRPISDYAETYLENGKFPEGKGKSQKRMQATDEILSECVSAYLTGFIYQTDTDGLDPFVGREALRDFTHNFLHAEWAEREE